MFKNLFCRCNTKTTKIRCTMQSWENSLITRKLRNIYFFIFYEFVIITLSIEYYMMVRKYSNCDKISWKIMSWGQLWCFHIESIKLSKENSDQCYRALLYFLCLWLPQFSYLKIMVIFAQFLQPRHICWNLKAPYNQKL